MTYRTPEEAFEATAKRIGATFVKSWTWPNGAITARFALPDGDKTFRPYRPADGNGGGWEDGDPPGLWPLYRKGDLDRFPGEPVFLVEGEAKADLLANIGLTATTSAHGANGAAKTDWTPLAGREVFPLHDNDAPGRKYAETGAAILTALDPPATVKIVTLPGLPPKGDVIDWIAADGPMGDKTPDEIKAAILDLVAKTAVWTAPAESESEHAVFVRLSDVTPQPVRWLWPNRIALGKLCIVAGNPGLGKSCITLDLAARITRGDGWPDCSASTSEPGGVLLLSAEDDLADTIRPRLDAAEAVVSRILALTTIKRYDPECQREVFASFNLATDLPILEQGIAQVENCRLVIIDPISAFLGRADSHNDAQVRGLLAPLAELAARHHVAVVGVSHLNKGQGDALARVMGSIGFVAAARAVYAVTKDRDDPSRRLFLPVKNNLGNDTTGLAYRLKIVAGGVPHVVWDPTPVVVSADDAVAPLDQRRGPEPENREEAQAWLMDFLAGGPRPANECFAEALLVGITRVTLKRAKAAAGVVAEKQGYDGPWTWRLPGYETPPQTALVEGAHVAPVPNNLNLLEGT